MVTDAILRLLMRALIVPLGYVCGMLATMAVVVIGYWQIGNLLAGVDEIELFAILDALMTATMALTAVVTTMWLIASIGILFAECFAVRSWIFHTANGAISAWLGAQLFSPYDDAPGVPPGAFDSDFYIIAAGLAGGLAYWLVAGWSAGFWKPVRPTQSPPLPAPAPSTPLPPPAENAPRQK